MYGLIVLLTLIHLLFSTVVASGNYNDNIEEKVAWANTALTGRLLYNQYSNNPGHSLSVASLPILTVIAQSALHAEGNKFYELAKWLNLDNKDEIRYVFSSLIQKFKNDTNVNLTFKLFEDERDRFSGEFKQNFRNICYGDEEYVDYSNVCDASNRINFWFKRQYKGLAGDVIDSAYLKNRGRGLVFGTYMETRTSFDHPFNPKGLVDIEFYKSIHDVQSQVALYGNAFARYAELPHLNAKMLMLFSKGIQDSIVWLYPNNPDDLLDILYKIQDPNVFNGALSQLKATCLKLHVTIGQAHEVNRYSTFVPDMKLDLSGLNRVYNDEPAHVFSILQQLHLVADQDVRDGPINSLACPDHVSEIVKFNHPFIYFNLNKQKTPIFAGVFYGY